MGHTVSLPPSVSDIDSMLRVHSSVTSGVNSALVWMEGGFDSGHLWCPRKSVKVESTDPSLWRGEGAVLVRLGVSTFHAYGI